MIFLVIFQVEGSLGGKPCLKNWWFEIWLFNLTLSDISNSLWNANIWVQPQGVDQTFGNKSWNVVADAWISGPNVASWPSIVLEFIYKALWRYALINLAFYPLLIPNWKLQLLVVVLDRILHKLLEFQWNSLHNCQANHVSLSENGCILLLWTQIMLLMYFSKQRTFRVWDQIIWALYNLWNMVLWNIKLGTLVEL